MTEIFRGFYSFGRRTGKSDTHLVSRWAGGSGESDVASETARAVLARGTTGSLGTSVTLGGETRSRERPDAPRHAG